MSAKGHSAPRRITSEAHSLFAADQLTTRAVSQVRFAGSPVLNEPSAFLPPRLFFALRTARFKRRYHLGSRGHHDPNMIPSKHHPESHFSARADPIHHGGYIYNPPPPPFDHRYDHSHPVSYHTASGLPTHFTVPPPPMAHPPSYGHPYPQPGNQASVPIIHTDDAATKLSDRVRRRCFNCCTTDTSTWRRSNLSPGKVVRPSCHLFRQPLLIPPSCATNAVSLSVPILVPGQSSSLTSAVLSPPPLSSVERHPQATLLRPIPPSFLPSRLRMGIPTPPSRP